MTVMRDARDSSYELRGLAQWTKYTVTVVAVNSGGDGDPLQKTFISPEIGRYIAIVINVNIHM